MYHAFFSVIAHRCFTYFVSSGTRFAPDVPYVTIPEDDLSFGCRQRFALNSKVFLILKWRCD
jgi:hypothetical protein